MAGTSYMPLPVPAAIISPHFCVNYPVKLVIDTLFRGSFVVSDVSGENIMFKGKCKGSFFSIHNRCTLLDAADNPIITFRAKSMSAHERWQVFRGDSRDSMDLLFSVKWSSLFQSKTKAKLDVILASNPNEDNPDFRVEGSWLERKCVIYAGKRKSNTVVPQMHIAESIPVGKDKFVVTVCPNVDSAFITAIVVIFDLMNADVGRAENLHHRSSDFLHGLHGLLHALR